MLVVAASSTFAQVENQAHLAADFHAAAASFEQTKTQPSRVTQKRNRESGARLGGGPLAGLDEAHRVEAFPIDTHALQRNPFTN
jgi:hypothetical protein